MTATTPNIKAKQVSAAMVGVIDGSLGMTDFVRWHIFFPISVQSGDGKHHACRHAPEIKANYLPTNGAR
jgi:hypothetical protein